MKSAKAGFSCARCTVCRIDFKDLNAKLLPLPAQLGSFHGYDARGSQAGWIVISSSQGGRQELKACLGSQLPCRYLLQSKLTIANPMHLAPVGAVHAVHPKDAIYNLQRIKRHCKWREGRRGLIKAHQGPNCCCLGLAAFVEAWRAFSPCDFKAACAAARRAMGTRKGEHET